jgi:hypothetical protein
MFDHSTVLAFRCHGRPAQPGRWISLENEVNALRSLSVGAVYRPPAMASMDVLDDRVLPVRP